MSARRISRISTQRLPPSPWISGVQKCRVLEPTVPHPTTRLAAFVRCSRSFSHSLRSVHPSPLYDLHRRPIICALTYCLGHSCLTQHPPCAQDPQAQPSPFCTAQLDVCRMFHVRSIRLRTAPPFLIIVSSQRGERRTHPDVRLVHQYYEHDHGVLHRLLQLWVIFLCRHRVRSRVLCASFRLVHDCARLTHDYRLWEFPRQRRPEYFPVRLQYGLYRQLFRDMWSRR